MHNGLQPRNHNTIPKIKVPFRLQHLQIDSVELDAAAITWLCGSSGDTLQHLILKTYDNGELPEEMEWIGGAKHVLAQLPRLTIREHPAKCVEHLLRFTLRLLHLETHVDRLPPLTCLPWSLQSLKLTRPMISSGDDGFPVFIASLHRGRPSNVSVAVSFEVLPEDTGVLDQLVSACAEAGLNMFSH